MKESWIHKNPIPTTIIIIVGMFFLYFIFFNEPESVEVEVVENIVQELSLNEKISLVEGMESLSWAWRNISLGYGEDIDENGFKSVYLLMDVTKNTQLNNLSYSSQIDFLSPVIDTLFISLYKLDNNADTYGVVYTTSEKITSTSSKVVYNQENIAIEVTSYDSTHISMKNFYEGKITRNNFIRNLEVY
tara:strand:- start:5058 stop:5624 length:567 start_codon:yes stop_codon:yes gene_type:complete